MQRIFLLLLAMLALYLSEFAYATNDAPGRGAISPAPHIALLLPLKSAVFAPAAEALLQGFQAAAAGLHIPSHASPQPLGHRTIHKHTQRELVPQPSVMQQP